MIGPAAIGALVLTLALGPDGVALRPRLEPPATTAGLPLARLAEELPRLWLVVHHRDEWTMAFYLPAAEPVYGLGFALGPEDAAEARLLPGLRLPRLFLYAPYYRPDGRWRDAGEMAVDVAEHLYRALLEARLERLEASDAGFASELATRARTTMVSEPEPLRTAAFRAATTAFVASALSVAGELARGERRRRAGGRASVCRLIDHPATLFATWKRQVFAGPYPGEYLRPADRPGRPPRAVVSRSVLTPDDKRWALHRLLDVDWTGDPRHDFVWLCPQGDR